MIPALFIVFFLIAFVLARYSSCLGVIVLGILSLALIMVLAHAFS